MPQNIFTIYDGRDSFWQWDTGQKLIVSDIAADEVHFSNASMSHSLTKNVYEDETGLRVCDIPDIIFQEPKAFLVYAYDRESEYSRTIASMKYSVRGRPVPEEYEYENHDRLQELFNGLAAVEHALERGAVIRRFDSLQEAETWAAKSQEIGMLINVNVDGKWIPYVVDSDHSISRVDDDADIQEEIQQLKQLLGSEPVEKQIGDAITNLDLPNTYAPKDHSHDIPNGAVSLPKLSADVQTAIGKAHSHANETVLSGITADKIKNWDGAQSAAEATAANALNAVKSELEKEVAAVEKETNDNVGAMNERVTAIEKAGHIHSNKIELDKIASGDVAKWNATEANAKKYVDELNAATNRVLGNLDAQIKSEMLRADAVESGLRADVETIKKDYLKSSDKTELGRMIRSNADAIELLTNGVDSSTVDGVNDLIRYVKEHGTEVMGIKADVKANSDEIADVTNSVNEVKDNIPSKISDLDNDAGYITAADIPESSGTTAIIDVIELPTENIREDCFYRLETGTFVFNQFTQNSFTCINVAELPDDPEPVTTDMVHAVIYRNSQDGNAYGYVDAGLASMASIPGGWYTLNDLSLFFGSEYAGVITNILDDPRDDKLRLLLEYVLYSYKEGKWTSNKTIGWAGTGSSAEVFNHPSNKALGDSSHAEGYSSHAEGNFSHAEGNFSHAEGDYSHAEGNFSHAEGNFSHAEGYSSHAEGSGSHAEGNFSHAEGNFSHAEGSGSHAEGNCSHAEGSNSHAFGRSQHAQGEYNISDPDAKPDDVWQRGRYAHIVGNGTSDTNRSNAHTLDWDGNAWFQGAVKIGGKGQDDENAKELATKEYVDSKAGGGAAIIDVIELPTENINKQALYRMPKAQFVFNDTVVYDYQCYCVTSLPEVGEVVTDALMNFLIGYYNMTDNEVYGYVDEALGSTLGVPAGWYPFPMLASAAGVSWGEVITDIEDIALEGTLYLLLSYDYYTYKDEWTKMVFATEKPPKFDIKWDGVIGDRVALDMSQFGYVDGFYFVKVSDDIPIISDVVGGSCATTDFSVGILIKNNHIDQTAYPGAYFVVNAIMVVYDCDILTNELGIPAGIYSNGVYFWYNEEIGYTKRFTSASRITPMGTEYLPENLDVILNTWNDGEIPTRHEVRDMIDNAIGNAIGGSY